MKKLFTLCIVHQHPRILLGYKKRGFGAKRWNGFGGKVNPGESIVSAAKREVLEEAGITISKMSQLGILEFKFKNKPEILEVHIFSVSCFIGQPIESEEMKPKWFNINKIPFDQMWSDDYFWMPLFLKKKLFRGRFLFDENDNVLKTNLKEVSRLI